MWHDNILGDDCPETLLNMLIYLLGVHLALHGVQEHKDLKVGAYSQLQVSIQRLIPSICITLQCT